MVDKLRLGEALARPELDDRAHELAELARGVGRADDGGEGDRGVRHDHALHLPHRKRRWVTEGTGAAHARSADLDVGPARRARSHLGGVNILAAKEDHVLLPVDQREEAAAVHVPEVTRPEPAARVEGLGVRLWHPPVTAEHRRTAHAYLAHTVGRIGDFELHRAKGAPLRPGERDLDVLRQ